MDKQKKEHVIACIEALNALLENKKTLAETKELADSSSLRGVMTSVLMSMAIAGYDMLTAGQVAFSIGWALGRNELEGHTDTINVTKDFPSEKEVMDIVNKELSAASEKHFRTLEQKPDIWNDTNWEDEIQQ